MRVMQSQPWDIFLQQKQKKGNIFCSLFRREDVHFLVVIRQAHALAPLLALHQKKERKSNEAKTKRDRKQAQIGKGINSNKLQRQPADIR